MVRTAQLGCALAAIYGGYYGLTQSGGNLHPLVEGEAYRSGQLSPAQLNAAIDRYGIRSILNLRGGNYGKAWYQNEVSLAKQRGVTHIDLALSSKREVTDEQARQLLDTLRSAPKPLLIHCEHGADRTGLASALYMASIHHADKKHAAAQLSWRFGHLPAALSGKDAMDKSFEHITTAFGLFTP